MAPTLTKRFDKNEVNGQTALFIFFAFAIYSKYKENSDGSIDYYDENGELTHRIGANKERYTFVKNGEYYEMYDKNGNVIDRIQIKSSEPERSEVKRIYTVSEAEAALGKNNKNTFILRYR